MNAASAELTAFTGMTGGEVMSAADFAILQRNAEMVAMENMEAFFVKKRGIEFQQKYILHQGRLGKGDCNEQ